MQAVMSSDVAIAQFSFLELLLLVHGHWCYRRISSMICYAFDITLFLYEEYTSFSAQPAYNDWCLSLYNVFFTSFPAIALEVFDQDVSGSISTLLSQVPITLPRSPSVLFSWRRIIAWMVNGLCTALIILFIWGGIALWYLFLLAYGAMPLPISTTAYKVFVECLAPAPSFWIVTIFVVISAMIPYFAYAAIQMWFFPMYHGVIQWMRLECRTEDPE